MLRSALLLFTLFLVGISNAQDSSYAKEMIDSLCAPRYHGRGYVFQGDVKAASFIERQCKEKGLKSFGNSYAQSFTLGVNTFPGDMSVKFNGELLQTGVDYQVNPGSQKINGSYKVLYLKPNMVKNQEKILKTASKKKVQNRFVVIDEASENAIIEEFSKGINQNPLNAKGYVLLKDKKLTWWVSRRTYNTTILDVSKEGLDKKIKTVDLAIDQEWISDYQSQNVVAFIPGQVDSMIVFSAHFDHLGRMGKDTYIAGASDNASGSAMLLDLADYYVEHPPKYNTVFIWFAGEEAGLVGSKFFVEHPLFPLNKIKFLLNLDLMADAKKGITVVNGSIFNDAFDRLNAINERESLLNQVKARGAAANSDHYPFYEKGVLSFFIYTEGDYKHYHDVNDVPENIPLTNYSEVFQLITSFVKEGF